MYIYFILQYLLTLNSKNLSVTRIKTGRVSLLYNVVCNYFLLV